jgi:hypothetical protein
MTLFERLLSLLEFWSQLLPSLRRGLLGISASSQSVHLACPVCCSTIGVAHKHIAAPKTHRLLARSREIIAIALSPLWQVRLAAWRCLPPLQITSLARQDVSERSTESVER